MLDCKDLPLKALLTGLLQQKIHGIGKQQSFVYFVTVHNSRFPFVSIFPFRIFMNFGAYTTLDFLLPKS